MNRSLAVLYGGACYTAFLATFLYAIAFVAGFGVPTLWTRLAGNTSEPQTMGEFEARGIMTTPTNVTMDVVGRFVAFCAVQGMVFTILPRVFPGA